MKPTPCKKCGDEIENSFGFDATNSEFCRTCDSERGECKDCGDRDFLESSGRCYMCNETLLFNPLP